MEILDVELEAVEIGNELSDTFFIPCSFCKEMVWMHENNLESCKKLANNLPYCPFCIRHNFHSETNKNVMILSFRAIVGYYYYHLYDCEDRSMWLNEIKQMVVRHEYEGLENPVFSYNRRPMLWFVDFNRVGESSDKAPYSEVEQTVKEMLNAFEVECKINKRSVNPLWEKFSEAITLFYEKRHRPKSNRMLIPTLRGQAFGFSDFKDQKEYDDELAEKTKNFTLDDMILV